MFHKPTKRSTSNTDRLHCFWLVVAVAFTPFVCTQRKPPLAVTASYAWMGMLNPLLPAVASVAGALSSYSNQG